MLRGRLSVDQRNEHALGRDNAEAGARYKGLAVALSNSVSCEDRFERGVFVGQVEIVGVLKERVDTGARLGDMFGRRRLFLIGSAGFTLMSAAGCF